MIAFEDVTFGYDPAAPVVRGASLVIPPGLTLVLGPNGCGKSTLLKLAAGIERPDRGRVCVDGLDLWRDEAAARARLAFVPDVPELSPYASLLDVLAFVCRLRGEPLERSWEALDEVELAGHARSTVRELSAGQRRRGVLAAARIGKPPVLLLDEPLEAMDRPRRDMIAEWVHEAVGEGRAVVLVTHEFEVFSGLASRCVAVDRGLVTGPFDLPSEPAARRALLERGARGLSG